MIKTLIKKVTCSPMITWAFAVLWLSACTDSSVQFSSPPRLTFDSTNVLRATVSFALDQKAKSYIEYWQEAKPAKRFYSELSKISIQHHIILVGLKGATAYQYHIITKNNGEKRVSETYSLVTDKFPINVLHLRWQEEKKSGMSGYILSQRRMVNGVIYLIDQEGDVVWYQAIPKQPKLSHWTQNNTILVLYGAAKHRNSAGDHVVEYDLYGNELLHLYLSDLQLEAHHEVRFDSQGDVIALMYDTRSVDLSDQGGDSSQRVLGDQIVKMDRSGKVLWQWSVFDHLDPLSDASILKSANDWSHANSLAIDRDGHYLLSFRNFNQVWKVHHETGEVIWKLGEAGTLKMEKQAYFSGQHAFHVNRSGDYMLFDNGRKNRRARVLTFEVNEKEGSAALKWNILLPEELYSEKMGNACLMDNDNLLICAPRTNSIVVMDTLGTVLAHAKVGIPDPYRATFVSQLYTIDHVK